MGKLYELLKSGEVPAPSFGLDFERMGTNKIADSMVRGKYSRNSDKWTLNRHGILVKAEEDRISLDLKDGKVGYLAEPGGTNLLTDSNNFTGSSWSSFTTATVTEDSSVVAPDPQKSAWKLSIDSGEQLVQSGKVNGVTTLSIWVKRISTSGTFSIGRPGGGLDKTFDLAELSDGWERLTFTYDSGSGGTNNGFRIRQASGPIEFYIFGAQCELSPVPTSYIPTEGSTASRGADNLIFENAEDLIGQESGVMLVEVDLRIIDDLGAILYLDDGTSENLVWLERFNDSILRMRQRVNNGDIVNINYVNYTSGVTTLLATYENDKIQLYANGTKADEGSISGIGPLTKIGIGWHSNISSRFLNDHIRKAYLWNNADWLTDELAEELTT